MPRRYLATFYGESQLKSVAGVNYLYDGDGRRVSKSNGKLYWYGSGDDILAETDASGNTTAEYIFFGGQRIAMIPAGSNPVYYVEDLLSTSRVLTTNTGVVCYDANFYPFGVERQPYTSTCPQNYKFEGKERDTETGNDDFGARYYSNRFGRWLSADWSAVLAPVPYANLSNPQTLNLYSMVVDDPESFADLQGHEAGYHYAHDGSMIAPGDPNYPESKHPIRDTLLLGALTVTALVAPEAVPFLRGLLGLGLATAPTTMPIVTELLEGLTPGQQLTLGRAAAIGAGTIEKLGESGFVGTLQNGAKIAAGFEKTADNLAVNISHIETAARGSINFKSLEASAINLAKSEKATSATIKALNVTNEKLAQALINAGYVAEKVKNAFGRETDQLCEENHNQR